MLGGSGSADVLATPQEVMAQGVVEVDWDRSHGSCWSAWTGQWTTQPIMWTK